MRTGDRKRSLAEAARWAAAALLFFPCGPALADPGAGAGSARAGTATAAERGGLATDNPAKCGKCHSPCEDGRVHGGLPRAREPEGAALPLDADGRTTCTTCHDPFGHGPAGAPGAHLRISNLRRELCLACHDDRDAAPVPRVEIVSPRERAVVQEERLALIGRAFRLSGSHLTVRLNGSEFHLLVKEEAFSTWLTLQDGVNSIEVAQGERSLWKGEVFHGESSLGTYQLVSSGHRTGSRAQCQECHVKEAALRAGLTGAAPALCYGCHDRIDEKRYVHGPLAVGDCLACHDPHGGYGPSHLLQQQAVLCGKCHTARENSVATACNAAGRGCVDCHDPHQSDVRYLLKGPQYTMRDPARESR